MWYYVDVNLVGCFQLLIYLLIITDIVIGE